MAADTLVEGTWCAIPPVGPVSTYVCSVRTGADGLIDRYLAFGCAGARDPLPTDVDEGIEPADASAVVRDYFADLDDGRFAAAAARFSADVLYSHPPYQHTGIDDPGRIEFRGRPALLRGVRPPGQRPASITSSSRRSSAVLTACSKEPCAGFPTAAPAASSPACHSAGDGTIRRYVSFYCEPADPCMRGVTTLTDDGRRRQARRFESWR